MKRAGFDIQNFLITFIVFSGILVTLGSIAYTMGLSYAPVTGVSINNSFSSTYNKIGDISGDTNDMYSQMQTADVGNEDNADQFYGGALKVARIAFNSIGIASSVITDVGHDLHIPPLWIQIGILVLIILMFTTVLFMIFKSRG